MAHNTLQDCIDDLEKNGQIKGTNYQAVSNLFGTTQRSHFIFRDTIDNVKKMIALKTNPMQALKHPLQYLRVAFAAIKAIPKKSFITCI